MTALNPLPPQVSRVLESHHVAHLSIATEAHSAPVFFALWDGCLVWTSSPDSRHGKAFAKHPRAAASIAPSSPPLHGFSGVQLHGKVTSENWDQRELQAAFLARFPKAASFLRADHRFYRLRPSWVRLIVRAENQITRLEWPGPESNPEL